MKTGMARSRLWLAIASATGLATSAGVATAMQTSWEVGAGMEYSDNINRSEIDEEDELVALVYAGAAAHEDSQRLRLDVAARAEYRDYTEGAFDDETLLNMNAYAVVKIAPRFFEWVVEDYFRQAPVDVFTPPTPENRQDANVFSTGPQLHIHLSPTQSIELGARAESYYYEETDADAVRWQANAGWRNEYAQDQSIAVNYEASRTDYDEEDRFPDYDRHDLFVRSDTRHGALRLEADVGYSQLEREVYDDVDGYLARVQGSYEVSPRATLQAYYVDQYSDTGQTLMLVGEQNIADLDYVDQQVSGDIFQDQRLGARYEYRGDVNGFSVEAAHREEDYEVAGTDRRIDELWLELSRKIRPTLDGALVANYREIEYQDIDRRDEEMAVGLRLRYRARSDLRVELALEHWERESDDPRAEYDENRAMVYLVYGHFTPVIPER